MKVPSTTVAHHVSGLVKKWFLSYQVTSNYEVWRLYADLYLNEESMADKEKVRA